MRPPSNEHDSARCDGNRAGRRIWYGKPVSLPCRCLVKAWQGAAVGHGADPNCAKPRGSALMCTKWRAASANMASVFSAHRSAESGGASAVYPARSRYARVASRPFAMGSFRQELARLSGPDDAAERLRNGTDALPCVTRYVNSTYCRCKKRNEITPDGGFITQPNGAPAQWRLRVSLPVQTVQF